MPSGLANIMIALSRPQTMFRTTDYGPRKRWPTQRFHECFEAVADRCPDAAAIISDATVLTYRDVEVRANALARALVSHSLTQEQPVGVLTERSGLLPIALLAIFKAGGAYVPMSADLPADRLVSMIQQSKMRCLIVLDGLESRREILDALEENASAEERCAVLRPEEISPDVIARDGARLNRRGKPTDLAAILFTSGSTGRPKGVQLQHDAVLNMAFGHIDAQAITSHDRILLATAPGFILGFRELCVPLLAGAAHVPAPRALLDEPAKLLELMSRHRVSVAFFTPSYLRLFDGAVPAGLRCLITAGERPNAEDARAYARAVEVWNVHGATEVCGTICMMRVDPNGHGPIPSGRPFANTSVHLLNAEGLDVGPGETGEIYVVGQGVARGYLGQPDLTAASFVPTRYGRAYRTHDLGRWSPEGNLVTLGRTSDMVKVSGQAVSLGEIEQTLLRHPDVRHAFVVQHEGRLIAFVESSSKSKPLEDWHAFLGKTLPAFMLPAQVETLAEMPVNAAGKADRQTLEALAAALHGNAGERRGPAPQGELEQRIAGVWEDVLGTRPILRDDNYFALGGTSLSAIAISQKLLASGTTVAARTILTSPTIAALAEKITQAPARESSVLAQTEGIATKGQEDFWIAANLGLATSDAQITRILTVKGNAPAPEHWRTAWTALVARHAALRTAFFAGTDGTVRWRIAKSDDLDAGFHIDDGLDAGEAERLIVQRATAPFSLTEPPLARAGLVRLAAGETLFWFALHHAAADGVSARILQEEMHALLLGRALPEGLNGTAIAGQSEEAYQASPQAECDRRYWRDLLDGLAANEQVFSELPTDHSRPSYPSGKSTVRLTEQLDAATVAALTRLAQAQRAGLHALLLSLLAAEARRRSGRSAILIGTSVSVRPAWAEAAVGYFVNLPPLALRGNEADTLAAEIRSTQTVLAAALEHAAYPSGLLYREFRQRHPDARSQARTSLFDISLTVNPPRTSGNAETDFSLSPYVLPNEVTAPAAGLDLAFSHEPLADGGVELALVWNPDVYRQETAEAWLKSFAAWTRWLAEDSTRIDGPIPALRPDEIATLAQWENGPSIRRPAKRTHELIEAIADAYPDRLAVVTDSGGQTFSALENEANRIAQALIRHGVSHDDAVAVLTECSPSLPAAILGVWKAGAVYLPLPVEQPPERLGFIAKDAGAKILLALDGLAAPAALSQMKVLRPEHAPDGSAVRPQVTGAPQDPAYIIYTSGTTGTPKGVVLPHAGVVNVAYATAEATGLTSKDRVAFVATPGFDASIWEMTLGLVNGAAIVPVSRTLRDDPWALKQRYTASGVTVAFHAPSYLRISRETPFVGLRVLLSGGEAPTHDDARTHAYLDFWNPYGPTEATIIVSLGKVNPANDRPLTVGRPISNTCISIRRNDGTRVPPGTTGEVWLSGVGVAPGYLNNPDLTAKHFVETPEGRFYRTGDLARWTADGRLELQGRIDTQVKLHGQRIEPGEIERTLQSHPAIAEAVVLMAAAASETKALHAFVRLRPGAVLPEEEDWRAHLGAHLPQHMIPASVTEVGSFPLMANGKRDRGALLSRLQTSKNRDGRTPPRDKLESRIAAVWSDLLGEPVAREDNFFALGGNSLLAVALAHRLSQELQRPVPARDLFLAPTLAGFSARVAEISHTETASAFSDASKSDLATEGQREFWVAEAAGLDTGTFTIPLIRIAEAHPLDDWRSAWTTLAARHDGLRTSFVMDADGVLRRTITPPQPGPAPFEFSSQPDRTSAIAFIRRRQQAAFTMAAAPLWRTGLVTVADTGEQLFWLALHHSVGDGQSLGILVEELETLLRGDALPDVTGDFAAAAAREQAYIAGPECQEDTRYWDDLLTGLPDTAFDEAPLDTARSATAAPGMHRFETALGNATAESLRALARAHNTSLHAVMLSLLAIEARRRMGHTDVIVGTTASIRETAADARVIGYYVNMLPVPVHLPQGTAFADILDETGKRLAGALAHARYPFARIYQNHRNRRPLARHPSRYPLFDIAVTENPPASAHRMRRRGAEYELWDTSPGEDMVLSHEILADGRLLLQWHVNAAIYSRDTAERWLCALTGWAEWLAENPDRTKMPLPRLLPHESAQIEAWEYGPRIERPSLRFHEVFEQRLDGRGSHPAVLTQSSQRTYAEVECDANALAQSLIRYGVERGSVVGVLTGRSAALPAAVLGIWKAGATYLPLSSDLPPERLAFMAKDAGLTHLIALDGLVVPSELAEAASHIVRPEALDAGDSRPHVSGTPDDIAYILYTSGSTGRPKGTRISHRSYINMVLSTGEIYGLTPDDRTLMFSSPSFDVSLSDMGLPLAFGASICPLPYDVLSSPTAFQEFLRALKITVADVTPSYLRLFEGADLPTLRILITGGEAPAPADVRTYAPRLRYYNAYGPTENTISSTMALLSADTEFLSAGRPLPNTSVHICDAEGNPVPPGVIGEVWLGGCGLAQDYAGRPDLTAAAFVAAPRGRRYRSGDLGRWRANGALEIIGRADDQVKLNGIRVELGEIESALRTHPDVAQAVALLDRGNESDHRLWAFALPRPGKTLPAEGDWRAYLTERVPAYMIPAAVIAVDAIPLSDSGKVDKVALKRIAGERSRAKEDGALLDGLESDIARIWKELLGVQELRRDDNFFALGGHSLLAIAQAHRLEKLLGHPVPARDLFVEPTLRGFAARVRQWTPVTAGDVRSDRATEGQREFWVAEQAGLDTRGFIIPLTAIARNADDIPEPAWRAAWAAVVSRHEALRTGFRTDEAGALRRFAAAPETAGLEFRTCADLPAALGYCQARQSEPFSMGSAPLWRAGVVHVTGTKQILFWMALHHSVGDGVSLGILTDDLARLLEQQTPPPLQSSLDLVAGREETYLASSACQSDARYWQQTLSAGPDDTSFDEWPLDYARPNGRTAQSIKGAHIFCVRLNDAVATRLRAFARQHGASLHALFLTLLALEVFRRNARPAFLLGTAASTRETADEAELAGYFVNMLPVPCRITKEMPVEEVLQNMQAALAEGLQHVRYPFARIYQDFRRDQTFTPHPARFPLFDFAVAENPGTAGGQSGLHFEALRSDETYRLRPNTPAQDMVLVHEERADGSVNLQWYANAALYEKDTAAAWLDSLAGWAKLLASEDRPANTPLPTLLPNEAAQLARWEFGPQVPLPAPDFPARFEQWCTQQPDRPAVVTEQGILSYADVNARANALAQALKETGCAPQEAIGVFTGRSICLPETVLAIWKAGGCYVPLATELPADRLKFIIQDAGIKRLVVLDGRLLPAALAETGCPVLRPEALPRNSARNRHAPDCSGPAYVIYTSGSTGVPKGVAVSHQGLNNLGIALSGALNIEADDRVLLMASPAFDAWISDLAMAWAAGAAVVPVVRSEMDDIAGMRAKLPRLGVTVATLPPSYLRLFEQADFPGLRILMTVGEPPIAADAQHYAARLRYINGYGPTENTAATTVGTIVPGASRLTAGKPLANIDVHICDDHGNPVPPGSIGEVWLGGRGLATGYLNCPDLTAASFVETASGRRYRTGDLGRWTFSGDLQILGRSDGQVKLRGQRIELGEIEHLLGTHPGVSQSVVLVGTESDGGQTLWGFVCLKPGAEEPSQDTWHAYLAAKLPSYMVPSSIIRVSSIPVTHGGKIDRTALLDLVSGGNAPPDAAGPRRTAPSSEIEQRIAQVWSEHLNRSVIAREDNFFDLGGDSLRGIAVVNQLRRTFRCAITDLYEHPRLADFAAVCQYHPEHLHTLIRSAKQHWRNYQATLAAYEDERTAALAPGWRAYETRNLAYQGIARDRRDYGRVLLTGATGYLGSYVLRELLADKTRKVTALVRGADDGAARARLGDVLRYYFGGENGTALLNAPGLTVLAADLRRDGLGLAQQDYDRTAQALQAIYHCAANVKHFGHYRDFEADNVTATARLLELADHRRADFHFVSTLSTGGKPPDGEFHLFTEYDSVPDSPDENYYVRSKQEAERLVVAARKYLPNASIHRVGNIVYATDGGPLQRDIARNAFFRQLAAFLKLGTVPNDSHTWLCHVDLVARGLVRLAETKALANETHHLENSFRRTVASFIAEAESIRVTAFDEFLDRLEGAIDEPEANAALTETLENFGLYRGISPQSRSRRLEIVSVRTQMLLTQLGLVWPPIPEQGRRAVLHHAARLFAPTKSAIP
jgi:amino acid adenylation domain-containing protein/thioester reductase-like protein